MSILPTNILDKIRRASSAAVMTGAGVSAESGVPTFRGAGGLWKKYRAEDLATPEAFAKDPALVWEWYRWRQSIIAGCLPNQAHYTLAEMENYWDNFILITQNIDGLHARAGSKKILELHGNIWKSRCTRDGKIFDYVEKDEPIPKCAACGAILRPHVVWFREALDSKILEKAFEKSKTAEVFFVIGTSSIVQPAASLSLVAKDSGILLVEINPDETPITPLADLSLREKAGVILPEIWKELRIT